MNRLCSLLLVLLLSVSAFGAKFSFDSNQFFTSYELLDKSKNVKYLPYYSTFEVNQVNSIVSFSVGTTILLNVVATGPNLTYQWQVSTNGGASYNNISNNSTYSGSTSATLTLVNVSQTFDTYVYRCVVSSNGQSINSGTSTLQMVGSALCASTSVDFGYEYVSQVVINGVSFAGLSSFTDTRGYIDYTGVSIPALTPGSSFNVSVTVKTNDDYQEYVKLWIDFNKNGVPGDVASELVFDQVQSFFGTHVYSGTITIPANVYSGNLYARMIMQYAGSPNVCGTYTYGNTMDFKIPVTGGATPSTLHLALNKVDGADGAVISSPTGINTDNNSYTIFAGSGDQYILTASPKAGSKFVGWSGDYNSTFTTQAVTLSGDQNVIATFSKLKAPILKIDSLSSSTPASFRVNAEVVNTADGDITDRGFVISTSANPTTTSGTKYAKSTGYGQFYHDFSGLTNGTTYYLKAYAINSIGTSYSEQRTFTIASKSAQTITVNPITSTYGDGDVALSATASSGLAISSYSSADNAVAEPYQDASNGNIWKLRLKKVGQVVITAQQSGNDNYISATNTFEVTINKKAITVTATANQSKVYGATDPTLAYTVSPALVGSDVFTGSLSRASGENVGSYTILVGTLSAGSNYDLTLTTGTQFAIIKRAITVTAMANQSKVYGATEPALSFSVSPALVGSDNFTGALSRVAGENVGNYAISIGTLSAGGNYDLTFTAGTQFAITKKPIIITATPNLSKIYGQADPDLAYSLSSSLVGSDNFIGSLHRETGEEVGKYLISLGSLKLNNNYEIFYQSNYFEIQKRALVISATGIDKMYDGTPEAQVNLNDNRLQGDQLVLTYKQALFSTSSIGQNHTVTVSGLSFSGSKAKNYELSQEIVSTTASILPRRILVSAINKTKVYGESDPELNYTLNSTLLPGDAIEGKLIRVAGENVGTYTITKGTLRLNSNYVLDFEGAQFSIQAKPITIQAISISKVYGDLDPSLEYNLSGLINGDVITGQLNRVLGENVGTYTITQGTLSVPKNYILNFQAGALSIQKALLKIGVNNASICQGGNLPAFTFTYEGFKRSDNENNLSLKPNVSTTANRNSPAGNYNLIPSGAASANYNFEYFPGQLTINPSAVVKLSSNGGLRIKKGTVLTLTASGAQSYTWENAMGIISGQNSANLLVSPTQNTVYTVNALNATGCLTSASISIEVIEEQEAIEMVKGTNIVTPNGDGKNDNLVIKNIELFPNNEIIIYDLAGRIVYRKKGYDNSWMGTLNGSPLAKGTYYYIIDFGDGKTKKKGFVSIVRN